MTLSTIAYSPVVSALLADAPLNGLGPGRANSEAQARLDALTPETLVSPHTVADRSMALACCAGLWLRHDYLDESHRLSQEIATAAGSYWHAIMHRREPDFDNSKYWFRRVGRFGTFDALLGEAQKLTAASPVAAAAELASQTAWDPFRFVDLCAAAAKQPALTELCRLIQRREWELLFDDCLRRAVG